MNTHPFFSIIVPTHKRAGLLRRALHSIKSQQPPAPFEVIVVSDLIDPDTDTVCAELLSGSDTYVRRSGAPGPSASRNLGLSLAKGRYILFLDDDDAWHPGFLDQLHAHPLIREGHPVYFNCTVVIERRLPDGPEFLSEAETDFAGRLTDAVYVKNQLPNCCLALPRHLLQGIGFDPFMRAYEDWEFLLAVLNYAKPVHVPLTGVKIFQVQDETTDRRGSSQNATDFNAVLDYLYVYRRHPAPNPLVAQQRAELLASVGISVDAGML